MKKNVVLADNSYTIRRIVELSFSDEEDIELVSLENGKDIENKLLELKPSVVLVDIKLPDMNGYEVCKFINENESLKMTKVFLIKGGFEPVDEDQLKGLAYEDFITKPFDSKALVITIKSIIDAQADEDPAPTQSVDIPSSMPEEISEINDIMDKSDSIDFSGVQSDISTSGLTDNIDSPESDTTIRDEVLPSEEITQGSGIDDEIDKLSPEQNEELANPFKGEDSDTMSEEELVKENIKKQEAELEINSLTMEEINIQKEIEQQKSMGNILPDDGEINTDSPDSIEITIPENEKETLDPSLNNMDSADLESVFSINSDSSDQNKTDMNHESEFVTNEITPDPKEDTKDQSDNIKQVLENLEAENSSHKKIDDTDVKVPESVSDESLKESITTPPTAQDKDKIMEKVEDKLTVSVKEILWEIVPPLAEKIIKSEIEKLKSDVEKEYK